ncbi:hypothetical protein Pcinc_032313 [Petrolisthes cinctipes]|uniref:Uncharacterized protein n=1 Tax=Petrolisthes cinctipes TaxID=88211 RepID=A0AAE1K153_PETCI|nr:hypothetical protein Pcinc_032313 [Petrolisthes cinctipes]
MESSKAFKNLPLLVRHLQEGDAQDGAFTFRSRQEEKEDGVPFGLENSEGSRNLSKFPVSQRHLQDRDALGEEDMRGALASYPVLRERDALGSYPALQDRDALGSYPALQERDALGWSRQEQEKEKKRGAPERHTISSSSLLQRPLQERDALGNSIRLRQEEKRGDDGSLGSSRQEGDALGSSLQHALRQQQHRQEKENGEALGIYPFLQRYYQEGDALGSLRYQQTLRQQQQQQHQQQGLRQDTDALRHQQQHQQQQHGRHHHLPQLQYPLNIQEEIYV